MAAKYAHREEPIFFDQKGRRWKRICIVFSILLLALAAFLYVTVPKILDIKPVQTYAPAAAVKTAAKVDDSASGLSPAEVAAVINQGNIPFIGKGPLLRVAHVQKQGNNTYAVPLYNQGQATALSATDLQAIGDHEFVVQRYGIQTVPNQLALTFDDGPDPTWTREVLDVLAKNGVQATFFVVGKNAVEYPDLVKREASEGHTVGNHTFDHIDFDAVSSFQGQQEVNQTERVVSAITGHSSSLFRMPYMGNDEQSIRTHILGLLTVQRSGYVLAGHDFDTDDWEFQNGLKPSYPKLDGKSQIILMHDAGGDRSKTVEYIQTLVDMAKAKGYKFVTLNQMYSQQPALYAPAPVSTADKTSFILASSYLTWPRNIIGKLFFVTIATIIIATVTNITLAAINLLRARRIRTNKRFKPLVSVIISAYNEEKVLEQTVRSVLGSNYRKLEIIIVDDGSKDDTAKVAFALDKKYKRVRGFSKKNGGKSSGLNFGIKHAKGDIIVGIDADTIFPAETLGRLVRHFADPKVGAVAGNVKVGNIQNLVTRWQQLDYIIGIYIERNAQAFLNSVMIVPGACGAWRKSAILAAGGYSHLTLAEDFDLTLNLQRLGYTVKQDNTAMSYTEAPDNVTALRKQRFRWMYGSMQVFWKHRDMIFRRKYGWIGMFFLPMAIFNVLLPIFFVPLLILVDLENILAGNVMALVFFFFITIAMQGIIAAVAIILARERFSHLLAVPMTRVMYNPIRTYNMYRTVFSALRGIAVGWNKLQRTGAVKYKHNQPNRVEIPVAGTE